MTVPGNSTLLLTLLAALIASTGYAGGRIHQWYRMGRDRDEAFRDGYDTATRSVFSLAARVISPRRGDRAAVRGSTGGGSAGGPGDGAGGSFRGVAGESGSVEHFGFVGSGGGAGRVDGGVPGGPGSGVPTVPGSGMPGRPASGAQGGAGSGVSGGSVDSPVSGASARNVPSAFSGSATGAGSRPVSSGRAGGASSAAESVESSGRHTVPDELVRADTYRLAPDRVARAKVHGRVSPIVSPTASPPGASPATADGKPRAAVPKPRSS